MGPSNKRLAKLVLPTEVYALGIKFTVKLVDKVDDTGSVGETLVDHRIIKVDKDQDTRRQWTTLFHEYMHAVLHTNGIGNVLDPDLEEVIVQSTEHAVELFMLNHGRTFLDALEVQKGE
jgi:Zn-dependent peptidase ImmA (M78 family)